MLAGVPIIRPASSTPGSAAMAREMRISATEFEIEAVAHLVADDRHATPILSANATSACSKPVSDAWEYWPNCRPASTHGRLERIMTRALCRDCCEIVDAASAACGRCGGARLVAHAEIESLGIAHIDCDAFYASVEKRDRPELAREPLIVGHAGGRGVVVTACYIARTFGARSAMPMFQALELCPHATVIAPDMGKYKRVSEEIRTIFAAATSIVEPVSLDEAYLDLTDDYRTEAPPAAEALALIAAGSRRRSASPCRSGYPATSSWPSSPRSWKSRAASRPSAGPRRRRSWRRCRCARSTVSARSRPGAWKPAVLPPSPTCRR